MTRFRSAAIAIYVAVIGLGIALAGWALTVTYTSYGSEPLVQTVRRGGAGLSALFVSAVFALVLGVRGFRYVAPAFFVICYSLAAAVADFSLSGYMKGWPPSGVRDAAQANRAALLAGVAVLCFVIVAAWLSSPRKHRMAG